MSEIRDEPSPRGAASSARKRRSNRLQPKASLGQRHRRCVTARRWKGPRWFKPTFVRLRGRRARRGITTETSEAKIVATASSENLGESIERSRQSKPGCVNRRVSRTNRRQLRQIGRATEARVQRGREKFGWHPLVGSIWAPLCCRLERAGSKRVHSPKEAAERGRRVAVAIGRKGTCARDFEGSPEKN